MNKFVVLAFAALLASCQPDPPVVVVSTPPSDTETQYISLCSGLDASDDVVRTIGMASCLGRMRGFVDGHQITMQLLRAEKKHQLWCVDPSVTDKEVLDAVIGWIDNNPKEYKTLVTLFDSGLEAATAVMMRAINNHFPCEESA